MHSIKTELLELAVSDQRSAASLQNRVADMVHRQLNPALDQLFTRIGASDEIVRIDRMVVDLGTFREDGFDEQFVERALKGIEEQLLKAIADVTPEVASSTERSTDITPRGKAKILSPSEHDLEVLICFLESGCFPWWNSAIGQHPADELLQRISNLGPGVLKERLLPHLRYRHVRRRLVNQCDESLIVGLLRIIDESATMHFQVYSALFNAFESLPVMQYRHLRKLFLENVLERIALSRGSLSAYEEFVLLKTIVQECVNGIPDVWWQQDIVNIARKISDKGETGDHKPVMILLVALISVVCLQRAETAGYMDPLIAVCGWHRYQQIIQLLLTFEPERHADWMLKKRGKTRQPGNSIVEGCLADSEASAGGTFVIPEKDQKHDIGIVGSGAGRESESGVVLSEACGVSTVDGGVAGGVAPAGGVSGMPERDHENGIGIPCSDRARAIEPGLDMPEQAKQTVQAFRPSAVNRQTENQQAFSGKGSGTEHDMVIQVLAQSPESQAEQAGRKYSGYPVPFYEADDIAVANAGLVILHPFLKHFFRGLGLLDDLWQFRNRDNAYKAVHLLQYLISGTPANAEYALPLNKILCGLDFADPVPDICIMSDTDIEECENLLQAVLQQWQSLRTKRTEALRETFLKRNGVLIKGAQGWILKVERNTFDVLLDRLPWPLSLIAFPWTPTLLSVEW
jgi:hypothetical protein